MNITELIENIETIRATDPGLYLYLIGWMWDQKNGKQEKRGW